MIRQALFEDVDEIRRLEAECFDEPWTHGMIEGELRGRNRVDLVAIDEERIIGYVLANRILDEIHVNKIGVERGHRRRGLARELMRAVEAIGRRNNVKKITLEVREANVAAREFYGSLGFSTEFVRRHYYSNQDHAVFMSRELD